MEEKNVLEKAKEFERKLAKVVTAHLTDCTALHKVERLSGGASQETYRLTVQMGGQEVTLAMRRGAGGEIKERGPTSPGLDVEAKLMQAAKANGVPEPQVYRLLQPEDGLGEGFIMQWLDGEALGARINRAPEFAQLRPKLALECGRILARIHAIDTQATGLSESLTTVTPAEFLQQTYDNYLSFNSPQPMIDYTAKWLQQHLPQQVDYRLVHNDFRNGNFMVNSTEVVAVLDWELAHIGDPMRDLGWLCTNSWRFGGDAEVGGFGELDDLIAGYQDVSGTTVDKERVRYWQVFGSFWWAVGCLGMAEHYRNGPDKTVERPAIGRRSSECQVDCVNLLIPGAVQLLEQEQVAPSDMPSSQELLLSVRDFLRNDVMSATSGRENFLSRVASNSLDIVIREQQLGGVTCAAELTGLRDLFASDDELTPLRWRLVEAIRSDELSLDDVALQKHLRSSVVNQVAIDQPRYSGLKLALA